MRTRSFPGHHRFATRRDVEYGGWFVSWKREVDAVLLGDDQIIRARTEWAGKVGLAAFRETRPTLSVCTEMIRPLESKPKPFDRFVFSRNVEMLLFLSIFVMRLPAVSVKMRLPSGSVTGPSVP
jgi:hypothetical protein